MNDNHNLVKNDSTNGAHTFYNEEIKKQNKIL